MKIYAKYCDNCGNEKGKADDNLGDITLELDFCNDDCAQKWFVNQYGIELNELMAIRELNKHLSKDEIEFINLLKEKGKLYCLVEAAKKLYQENKER